MSRWNKNQCPISPFVIVTQKAAVFSFLSWLPSFGNLSLVLFLFSRRDLPSTWHAKNGVRTLWPKCWWESQNASTFEPLSESVLSHHRCVCMCVCIPMYRRHLRPRRTPLAWSDTLIWLLSITYHIGENTETLIFLDFQFGASDVSMAASCTWRWPSISVLFSLT